MKPAHRTEFLTVPHFQVAFQKRLRQQGDVRVSSIQAFAVIARGKNEGYVAFRQNVRNGITGLPIQVDVNDGDVELPFPRHIERFLHPRGYGGDLMPEFG